MSSLSGALPQCVFTAPTRVDTDTVEAEFIFPENFIGFSGHFPNNPVLPGIVQIMSAVYTATSGSKSKLLTIKKSKFTRPVKPQERVKVITKNKTTGPELHCTAKLFAENELCSSISMVIALIEEPS